MEEGAAMPSAAMPKPAPELAPPASETAEQSPIRLVIQFPFPFTEELHDDTTSREMSFKFNLKKAGHRRCTVVVFKKKLLNRPMAHNEKTLYKKIQPL